MWEGWQAGDVRFTGETGVRSLLLLSRMMYWTCGPSVAENTKARSTTSPAVAMPGRGRWGSTLLFGVCGCLSRWAWYPKIKSMSPGAQIVTLDVVPC